MEKLSNRIDQVSRFFIIAFFAVAFICTVYQVFSRFVLQSTFLTKALPMFDFSIFNFTWIEELIRYLFVWVVFLGIGIVYKAQGHAKVEILQSFLPEKWKKIVTALVEVINSVLFVFLIFYGANILKFISQQISPSLGINMTLIYVSVLVSACVCLVHSILHFLEILFPKKVAQEVSNVDAAIENTIAR